MAPPTAKIGLRCDGGRTASHVIWVEPWGEDYTLRPGEGLEIVATGRESVPWFNLVEWDQATSVYIEGGCTEFAVYQNGQRIECGHNREA